METLKLGVINSDVQHNESQTKNAFLKFVSSKVHFLPGVSVVEHGFKSHTKQVVSSGVRTHAKSTCLTCSAVVTLKRRDRMKGLFVSSIVSY